MRRGLYRLNSTATEKLYFSCVLRGCVCELTYFAKNTVK